MTDLDVKGELLRFARSLRPDNKPFVSVLEIARSFGIVVSLQLQDVSASQTAQIDLRTQPARIILYRFGKVRGERQIGREEEGLLSSRERFSIAHELGHWLIFSHFQIGPQSDERLYWEQEEAVNFFAGHLLVPDWLAEGWLKESAEGTPVSPFALRYWAEQCQVSEEVIAKALARHKNNIGFLRLLPIQRKRDGVPVLQVLSSSTGDSLQLPNERSHIDNPKLRRLLEDGKVGATTWFSQLQLGRCAPQNLGVAWRRGNKFRSEETFWLSVIQGENATAHEESGIASLFG
jgi:hypothetical protein